MGTIKNSELDDARGTLHRATSECMAGYEVATARVFRLLGSAFEDGERAKAAFLTLSRQRGTEEIIRILAEGNGNSRLLHFGFTNGALFARGNRHVTRQALDELPEAIRERQAVGQKLADLLKARRTIFEQEDQMRLEREAKSYHYTARSRARG